MDPNNDLENQSKNNPQKSDKEPKASKAVSEKPKIDYTNLGNERSFNDIRTEVRRSDLYSANKSVTGITLEDINSPSYESKTDPTVVVGKEAKSTTRGFLSREHEYKPGKIFAKAPRIVSPNINRQLLL